MFSSNTSAVSGDANYIEDVFSTYLYTGNGNSARSISNGIDLSTKGGMVWLKNRTNAYYNNVFDTARGVEKRLYTNTTDAQVTTSGSLTAFNTDGFSLGTASFGCNDSGNNIASWTFRKQPKFFDVVTYTGNGTSGRTIAHSLGSVPGCIIVKNTSNTADWAVYHRSLGSTKYITLNATDPADTASSFWNNTDPTSTNFTVGSGGHQVNWNGETYVAYIFAHDAGGFGLTGTDNVISCGSFTTDGSGNATVNLGYEPQWVLMKSSTYGTDWVIIDNMRGMVVGGKDAALWADLSSAEASNNNYIEPSATGFSLNPGAMGNSQTSIYIAIRRGPMKVPTDGTTVFAPVISTDTENAGTIKTTSFPIDFQLLARRTGDSANTVASSRLTSVSTTSSETGQYLKTSDTVAEAAGAFTRGWNNTGFTLTSSIGQNPNIFWNFRRAPSFFDEVCYTGTGSARTVSHNLKAAPQLIIVKNRQNSGNWKVWTPFYTEASSMLLNGTSGNISSNDNGGYPTNYPDSSGASVFAVYAGGDGSIVDVGTSGETYVAYLFATCPGVSKVGSYTGTGTTKQVDCGFAAGARFVLIKRIDSNGNWYVWDTARGIVSGNDPYLLLNSTAAEVTSTDYIDTYSAGFELSSTAPAALNASGGTYIFLAIA